MSNQSLCADHVVACELSTAELSCDSGQTILLIGAFYGRADRTTCIYGRPDGQFNNINCFTRTANRIVAERCNGKKRCSVYAMNSVFQDPCSRTTYKYIQTTYTCLPARESCHSVKYCNTASMCVSVMSNQSLCADHVTIALIGAFYGRADRTTCIQGVPDGQFNNITCSTPTANQVVTERCNGKSRCSVYAVNSVFQDACYGTTKYLELAYSCECKFWKQTVFFFPTMWI
uniref:SUEL-type lectin domain-containing protein n=1 Tax=Gadus morhua TaxID=8049 RepID=A0A8C5A6A7_GADMO